VKPSRAGLVGFARRSSLPVTILGGYLFGSVFNNNGLLDLESRSPNEYFGASSGQFNAAGDSAARRYLQFPALRVPRA